MHSHLVAEQSEWHEPPDQAPESARRRARVRPVRQRTRVLGRSLHDVVAWSKRCGPRCDTRSGAWAWGDRGHGHGRGLCGAALRVWSECAVGSRADVGPGVGGTLRVGVSPDPPLVVAQGQGPTGALIHVEAFAQPRTGQVDVQQLDDASAGVAELDWNVQDVVIAPRAKLPEQADPVADKRPPRAAIASQTAQ